MLYVAILVVTTADIIISAGIPRNNILLKNFQLLDELYGNILKVGHKRRNYIKA